MKTRNIYLIVWLMLIACTAQAQLTCDGCAAGTPDPIIPAGGDRYPGNIVLTKNATFNIVGSGNFELSGVISGAFNIWLNASGAKLILSGKNTYTGTTVVNQGALGYGIDATNKSSNIIIRSGGVLSGGSSGNSGSINLEKLEFDSKESRFALYASGGTVSPIQLGEDGKGELKADNGGTIDIMDRLTLPDGEYPIIQGNTNAERGSKFVIGINNSGRCVFVYQTDKGVFLQVGKSTPIGRYIPNVLTGPVSVCAGASIRLTANTSGFAKDGSGQWTLKNNTGGGSIQPWDQTNDWHENRYAQLKGERAGTVTAVFTVSIGDCDRFVEYTVTVKPKPIITFNPPVHPVVGAGVDLEHNPGSTNIRIDSDIPETMVTWRLSRNKRHENWVRISKDGSTLEDIPIEGENKLTSDAPPLPGRTRDLQGVDATLFSATPEAGPLVYRLASNRLASSKEDISMLTFVVTPQYTSEGLTCYGDPKSITVNVAGVEIPADIGSLEKTQATLCDGGETNIRVGKEGDGNLYRWYSDENNGVKGNSNRPDNEGATTIKDRLTLNKQHSAGVVYYITPTNGDYVGATVRVPVVVNPTPSITTTLDKVSICNNTAPSIELATDIEEAEADKVTYTWTVSENNVGAISELTPVKKILPQTLTHTAATDESVIYSFIPAYTHAGVACAGPATTSEVLVRGAIVTGAITGIETSAVCLGDEVSTLSVASAGSGALKYQWMKDNVAIADANTASYTIPTAEISSGSYAVSVSNDCETKTADPKVLNVTADAYFEKAIAAADQTESASQGLIKFTYTGPSALYSWDFNDQAAISLLQNPAHNYAKGTWTPTLTVVKSATQTQCTKKFILSPLVIRDIATGDIATDRGISVYPVPAKDQVTISSQYELTGIAVRDMSGKNVMRMEANGYEKSISVSTLPVGLYILEIINSGGVKRIKMIKE